MQSFRGAPAETSGYDGDLRTAYVGVDARLSERWLAGVAVARSGGTGDWQAGSSSGRLTTGLTVLHPYVRWGVRWSRLCGAPHRRDYAELRTMRSSPEPCTLK